MKTKRAIWWIRRDLRLSDNPALVAAIQQADQVLPVFILDEKLLRSYKASEKRNVFLFANLDMLAESLAKRGGRLIVRSGEATSILQGLMEESSADVIFAEPDTSPYALRRDKAAARDLPIHWRGTPLVHPVGSVLRGDGAPYTVYTPFNKAWKSLPFPSVHTILDAPARIDTPESIASLPIPDHSYLPESALFPAGETMAQQRLKDFIGSRNAAVYRYAVERDYPALNSTSGLSPYLRFGVVSARQAAVAAQAAIDAGDDGNSQRSAETWLNELIWREFYAHILYHFPTVLQRNFRLQQIAWLNDRTEFAAWCEGRTGYPLVDAAMRQLVHTGWMHNRARMVAASFLTKDLLIDWRWGERWFMQHLIDGDPASNNGGWQWTAGTGTDAAPYFRIFNPLTQSAKFDPHGDFIRHWLPELRDVPREYIHQPGLMPREIQRQSGCVIGSDYPAPLVDHSWARQRALQIFSRAK